MSSIAARAGERGRSPVVYGMVGIPAEFDPHNQVLPNDFGVRVAFDSLLMPDAGGGLIPSLAESWRPIDSLTWEFALRSGVRFASGRHLTAESVQWNFDRVRDNALLAIAPRVATYSHSEVVGAQTIRFKTHVPDAVWPRRALQVAIADPAEARSGGFGINPGPLAGTGLYRIEEFVPNGYVRLETAGNTWRGRAQIPALEMRPYGPLNLEQALQTGDAHFGYVTEEQADRLAGSSLVLQRKLQANVHRLRINCLRPPFDDPRLREALSLTVNQQAIVAEVYRGRGWAPNQIVGSDCVGFDPDAPAIQIDLDRARELVIGSGFQGVLKFDILEDSAVIRPWCEYVLAALNAIGLRTEPVYVNMPTYLGKMLRNSPPRSDLIGAGNQYGPGLDATFAIDKFSNTQTAENLEYSNAEYQALYEESMGEFDLDRRAQLLRRCGRLLLDDHACLPVLQPALSWLVSPRLHGFKMNSLGAGWLDWSQITFE